MQRTPLPLLIVMWAQSKLSHVPIVAAWRSATETLSDLATSTAVATDARISAEVGDTNVDVASVIGATSIWSSTAGATTGASVTLLGAVPLKVADWKPVFTAVFSVSGETAAGRSSAAVALSVAETSTLSPADSLRRPPDTEAPTHVHDSL